MPVQRCTLNGKPGFRWGKSGKCYTYDLGSETSKNRAKKKAILQGAAIKASGFKEDAVKPEHFFIAQLKTLGMPIQKIRNKLKKMPRRMFHSRTPERKYTVFLKRLVGKWRSLYLQSVDPLLESLAQEAYVFKPPESVGIKTDTVNMDNWLASRILKYINNPSNIDKRIMVDAWPDKLEDIMKSYEQQILITLVPVENFAKDIGYDVSDLNLQQWKRVVSQVVGINLFVREPWLTDQINSFGKQNVQLITKLAEETRADIERIVEDGFQRGRRIESIRKDILSETKLTPGRFRKTRTRAELISRDQTAKLNGQLSQLRQNEIGIIMYIWRTVQDEKVRAAHNNMNGRLCRWDNASLYSNDNGKTWLQRSGVGGVEQHPGQDYQCRCFPEAVFSSIL